MQNSTDAPTLILASKSPRRQYLLKKAGLSVTVVPSRIDERTIPVSDPETYVKVLAEAKATEVSARYPESWVIGADTIVLIDGTILGKPKSHTDARQMLERLSGRTHQVLTGYALCCRKKERLFSETIITDVRFKTLSEVEIEWYIQTREPFDKAGAYAIQGIGTFLVKSIHGSYTNVVGLPVCEVVEFLLKEGIIGLQGTGHSMKEPWIH